MPSAEQTGIPPQPPAVKQQQNPALSQYAEGAMGATGAQANTAGAAKAFVQQSLAEIAEKLTKVAKVIATDSPELMPVVTRIAGGFKVLETELNKTQQGQGSPQGQGSAPTPNASEDSSDAMGM